MMKKFHMMEEVNAATDDTLIPILSARDEIAAVLAQVDIPPVGV